MNEHIRSLVETIHDCKMTNTYKMSWCRSLIEWSFKNPNKNQIHFNELFPLNLNQLNKNRSLNCLYKRKQS